jgi:hypothetical protein
MLTITLTRGKTAVVDDEDADLAKFKWMAQETRGRFYAARKVKGKLVYMHRVIQERKQGEIPAGVLVDHKDGDSLRNLRDNIRAATNLQNQQNRGVAKNNTTGYKGVSFDKNTGKWSASIRINGKKVFLGRHEVPELAAWAYEQASVEHYGEFHRSTPPQTVVRMLNSALSYVQESVGEVLVTDEGEKVVIAVPSGLGFCRVCNNIFAGEGMYCDMHRLNGNQGTLTLGGD